LRPKGEGASIMVPAFLCPCHGIIRLTDELSSLNPHCVPDTRVLHPGANRNGYFTNDDLALQTRRMLKFFEVCG
jgi:hypothetical protein